MIGRGKFLNFGLFVAVFTCILDQISKQLVLKFINAAEVIRVLPVFDLVLVWNRGVSFGMLNSLKIDISVFLSGIAFGVSIALFIWLLRVKTWTLSLGLGLIIGGAIGNAVDRIRFGAVTDFFYFHWHQFSFPAFNVADMGISVGVFFILLDSFLYPKGERS